MLVFEFALFCLRRIMRIVVDRRMLVRVGRDDNAPRFMVPDQLTVSVRRSDFFFV